MLIFDFEEDLHLYTTLKQCLSTLLPHKNYDYKYFSNTLNTVLNYVHLDEMPEPMFVIFNFIQKLNTLSFMIEGSEPKLERSQLESNLEISLEEYIKKNKKKIERWCSKQSELLNLDIEQHLEKAIILLANEVMNLYDECYSMELDSSSSLTLLVILSESFKVNVGRSMIIKQAEIADKGIFLEGRKLIGADDAVEFCRDTIYERDSRLTYDSDNEEITMNSIEAIERVKKMNSKLATRIHNWGIPQLDDKTPMLTHRLVVMVGSPNIGKTTYLTDLSAQCIRDNVKVLYACGESAPAIIQNSIWSKYVKRRYDKYITETEIMGMEPMTEEQDRLFNVAVSDMAEKKCLKIINSLSYDNCYEELANIYRDFKFDVVIIDHAGALEYNGTKRLTSVKEMVDSEAIQLRKFKNKFPVCVIVSSHPSSVAEKELIKHTHLDTREFTRDSNIWVKEADELFVLLRDEELMARNCIEMQVAKRRLAMPPSNHIVLSRDDISNTFDYREELQPQSKQISKKEELIEELSKEGVGIEEDDDAKFLELLEDEEDED